MIDPHLRAVIEDTLIHNVNTYGQAIMTKSVALRIWHNGTSALMRAALIFCGHRPETTFDELADRFCKQNGLLGRWNLDYTELGFVKAPKGEEGHFEYG